MAEPEDPNRQLVIVLSAKQAAALALAATGGLMTAPALLYPDFKPGKEPPPEDLNHLFFPCAEALDIINSAMGNPPSPSFLATLREAKKRAGYEPQND